MLPIDKRDMLLIDDCLHAGKAYNMGEATVNPSIASESLLNNFVYATSLIELSCFNF